MAMDIGYCSNHPGQSRNVVLADLGRVPQMPLDAMMEMVMPSLLSNEQIGDILEDLEARGIVAGDKWKAFDPKPSASSETESNFFNNRLPKLCQDIVDSASRIAKLPPTSTQTELTMYGSQTPFNARKNTSRPDGYFVLCGAPTTGRNSISSVIEVPPEWHDLASQSKSKNGPRRILLKMYACRNAAKTLWSMHHIMRCDPCRRFTFGITIEDLTMRLWFCDRALFLVSEPIDLHQNRGSLVALIIALKFASRAALGYDPTIQRVGQVGSKAIYRIKVHMKCCDDPPGFRLFETEDLLSDAGAEAFRGKGTRVWTVREVFDGKPTGPLMVLKDSFVNEDRAREGDTTRKIVESLPEGDKRRLHFLTVVVHGDVVIDDHPDTTDTIHHNKHCPLDVLCVDVGAIVNRRELSTQSYTASYTPTDTGSGHVPFLLPTVKPFTPSCSYQNRQHCRIVFKEVGEAVSNMKNRKDMFLAIQGALTAAGTMHDLGYVHRDISAGNVLLVDQGSFSKRGVLSDLEYAIKLGTQLPAHDVRKGTPFFMACEVEAHQYLAFNVNAMDDSWELPPLYYNRLHDVESFWWLSIWCIAYFSKNGTRPTKAHYCVLTERLFPPFYPSRHFVREHALRNFFRIADLPETQALRILEAWRVVLWSLYCLAEAGSSVNEDITKNAVPFMGRYVDELYGMVGDVPAEMTAQQRSPSAISCAIIVIP